MNRARLSNIIFTTFLTLIFSCSASEDQKLISAIKAHGIQPADSVQYLIYIPSYQCQFCLTLICDSSYNYLKDRMHLVLNQDTTNFFKGFKNAYMEKSKSFFEIESIRNSNKIIVFNNDKIINIEKLQYLERIKEIDSAYYTY